MNFNLLKEEDFLIPKDQRVPIEELTGEENVLNSSVIEKAFLGIMDDYKPRHRFVIFSLCTHTRPYIYSRKWDMLDKCFGDTCDLVVCSNGGVIPLEYMCCYPYMDYDAPHIPSGKYDQLYCDIFERRLRMFLKKYSWEKCIFLFIPRSRNYNRLEEMKNDFQNWLILPTEEGYRRTIDFEDLFIGLPRRTFGVCGVDTLLEIESVVGRSIYLHNLIDFYKGNKFRNKLF